MSATHTVDLDDLLNWIAALDQDWRTYARAGKKRLEFRHAGGYRVTVEGREVYNGTDGRSAVTAYNNIRN